jgi:uncharacterized HAD superfamily protein
MPLRIGCDLDGVLADMESELIRQARQLFADLPQKDVPRLAELKMTERQLRQLWHHVESIDGFWETLNEIEPGVVSRLAQLATERRWELIFLTKRPESAGATAQLQTQRWLQAKGYTLPSVFVVQGSRGLVAHAFNLDFVIDDRPENCLDVVLDSAARALLVWRDEDGPLPPPVARPGLQAFKSTAECLVMLERVDGTHRERPGLIGWLKRHFGFK